MHITSPKSVSTLTHVLLASSFYTQGAGWSTFFQAFPTPPAKSPHTCSRSTPTSISLSAPHQGIIPGINVRLGGTILLRDAVLDPSTQDVLITIRAHAFQPSHPDSSLSKYGTLRLSSASTSDDDEVGTVTFELLGPLGRPSTPFLHPSFNGTGRVFYPLDVNSRRLIAALEYDLCGSIGSDEDHGPVAKITDYPSTLGFSIPHTLVDYDPYSGLICLRFATVHYGIVEIVDVAV